MPRQQQKRIWLTKLMENVDEARWRCGVAGCPKLFKASDFLQKHLLSKHLDLLDADYKDVSDSRLTAGPASESISVHMPRSDRLTPSLVECRFTRRSSGPRSKPTRTSPCPRSRSVLQPLDGRKYRSLL